MAVLQIATVAQAGECQRLAAEHAAEPKIAARLHRQAEMMEREAHRSLKFLRTVQKARAEREADPVTRDADNALQQRLLATMTAALEHVQSEALRPAPAREPDRHVPSRTSDRAEGADPRGENIIVWPKVPITQDGSLRGRREITASTSRAAKPCVMAGLGPATHVFSCCQQQSRGWPAEPVLGRAFGPTRGPAMTQGAVTRPN